MSEFAKLIAGSFVRHILSVIAGYLAALGFSGEAIADFTNATTTIVLGLVAYVVSQGWSVFKKKK